MMFPHCDVHDLDGLLWTHVALLSFCAILIVASLNSQLKDAAPYGRHAEPEKTKAWGFPIPQRVGHIISDALPGILFLTMVYLLYAALLPPNGKFSEVRPINLVLLAGWLLHYLYRGILHPLIMPYSSKTVAVGITVAGMFPNLLFSYLIAAQLACTVYPDDWAARPRFIIGVILYAIGTAINRWADLKLRAGRLAMRKHAGQGKVAGCTGSTAAATPSSASTARESLLDADDGEGRVGESRSGSEVVRNTPTQGPRPRGDVRDQYFIPHGGLYELVSCPNYLGELIEWAGYALAVWSWPALAWMLFGLSTFIPRSLTHQRWYREHFGNEYPAKRKALIPFIL